MKPLKINKTILRPLCYNVTCGKTMKHIVKDFNPNTKKLNDHFIVAKMM